MTDLITIDYLREGNSRQKLLHQVLCSYGIMEVLKEFTPVVAGTIPIGIDLPESDVDILCCVDDFGRFESVLQDNFSAIEGFKIKPISQGGGHVVVCGFMLDGFEFELFGQDKPVRQQNGYKHMLIERYLLENNPASFRQNIVRLKKNGIKTEPAFSQLLGLDGDPYKAMSELYDMIMGPDNLRTP